MPKGNDDLLNPLGSTGINPNSESPNLTVEFETGAHPIVFPNREQISEFADFLSRLDQQENQSQVSHHDDDGVVTRDLFRRKLRPLSWLC